jgi:branched-chain amino acid transport system substrate-binding protein
MKKLVIAFVLLFSVFALSACQSSDGTQGVTKTTIKVGNTVATSGPLAFVGTPFKAGMQAYFDMVNGNGGVAGRTIEYIQYDDQFDSAKGLTYTQQLVEDDKVFAIVGHFGTGTVTATQSYLEEVGIPTVYYATGASILYNPDATGNERASFPVQPIYDSEGEVMVARALSDLNATSIGVIYSNDDAGKGILHGIQKRADELGITLPSVAQVSPTSDDMSVAAQIMVDSGVDVVIVAANQTPAATAIKALDTAGSTAPVITSYVNADATWLAGVKDVLANFDVYASAWINIYNSDGSFSDDYNTFAEEVGTDYAANAYAFAGWIAAATFVVGLDRVGTEDLTWSSFIDAMESAPVVLPFGVIVNYKDGNRVGTQAMAFLKGQETDGVASWATVKPIETIDSILAGN